MIAAYSVRLTILCFASFFLIHLALGLLGLALFPRYARASASMPPEWGSRRFIALRLAPPCLSILTVLCVCIPSYLRYETNFATEEIGWLCLMPACLGFLICVVAFAKAIRAVVQSSSLSSTLCAANEPNSWQLAQGVKELPSMALVGLLKPKVVVSPRVLETLTNEQFLAALDHERAHRFSRDNLKRLLILLAPDLLPFASSFRAMENHWERSAELSADDFATRGQPRRSIALAEALIKLARLEGGQSSPPLVSGLFAASEALTLRVERLLREDPATESPTRFRTLFCLVSCLMFAGSALLFPQLSLLRGAYPLLEFMLR
jgi:beta-lactamase regulating signal transducer with metallopeptidase domain